MGIRKAAHLVVFSAAFMNQKVPVSEKSVVNDILRSDVLCRVRHRCTRGPYDTIYSFGDSLTDEGNTLALGRSGRIPGLLVQPLPPYYAGRSSNGPVWIEYLAQSLGVEAPTPSLLGGTNFAYAGADTGTTPLHAGNPLDLLGPQGQLAQFRQAVPKPSSGALYTVWIGANDLYENFYALGAGRAVVDLGARNILLLTVPDLGLSPIITENYPAYTEAASALALAYNTELVAAAREIADQNGVNLHVFDTYALLHRATQDPGLFGLQNATDPCWTGDFVGQNGTVCADPSSYLFWDHYHPTTAAHRQIAAQATAELVNVPEPQTGAVLATGALLAIWVSRRRARALPTHRIGADQGRVTFGETWTVPRATTNASPSLK